MKTKSVVLWTWINVLCMLTFISLVAGQEKQPPGRRYVLGPDSQRQADVPVGTVTSHELLDCKTFPGTIRRYYVYVPQQYDGKQAAALMVFQDGHAYVNEDGEYRVPVVFDNLIHRREMPVTIGVFVDPGHKKDQLPESGLATPTRKPQRRIRHPR